MTVIGCYTLDTSGGDGDIKGGRGREDWELRTGDASRDRLDLGILLVEYRGVHGGWMVKGGDWVESYKDGGLGS